MVRTLWAGALLAASAALVLSDLALPDLQAQSLQLGAPRSITNRPIDTTKAMRLFDSTSLFRPLGQQRPVSTVSLFPKISLGQWPPVKPKTFFAKSSTFQPVLNKKGIRPFENPINPFNPPKK